MSMKHWWNYTDTVQPKY